MAKLLLNLRNVPDDEADDVRAMLESHSIDFYETRALMDEYQASRRERARAEREQQLRDGSAETFTDTVRRDPMRVVLSVLAIAFMLGLLALPAWLLRS